MHQCLICIDVLHNIGLKINETSANLSRESSQDSVTDERELIRKKRIERLVSSEKDVGSSSPISPNRVKTQSSPTTDKMRFEVGDMVKVPRKPKPWHGVVKWIGSMPNAPDTISIGLEMVHENY